MELLMIKLSKLIIAEKLVSLKDHQSCSLISVNDKLFTFNHIYIQSYTHDSDDDDSVI